MILWVFPQSWTILEIFKCAIDESFWLHRLSTGNFFFIYHSPLFLNYYHCRMCQAFSSLLRHYETSYSGDLPHHRKSRKHKKNIKRCQRLLLPEWVSISFFLNSLTAFSFLLRPGLLPPNSLRLCYWHNMCILPICSYSIVCIGANVFLYYLFGHVIIFFNWYHMCERPSFLLIYPQARLSWLCKKKKKTREIYLTIVPLPEYLPWDLWTHAYQYPTEDSDKVLCSSMIWKRRGNASHLRRSVENWRLRASLYKLIIKSGSRPNTKLGPDISDLLMIAWAKKLSQNNENYRYLIDNR